MNFGIGNRHLELKEYPLLPLSINRLSKSGYQRRDKEIIYTGLHLMSAPVVSMIGSKIMNHSMSTALISQCIGKAVTIPIAYLTIKKIHSVDYHRIKNELDYNNSSIKSIGNRLFEEIKEMASIALLFGAESVIGNSIYSSFQDFNTDHLTSYKVGSFGSAVAYLSLCILFYTIDQLFLPPLNPETTKLE